MKISPFSFLLLLLVICFTLATLFVPRAAWWNAVNHAADWNKSQSQSDNAFKLLLGEGRQLFANQLFIMGDVYFHSGYYPSMFDNQETDKDVADPAHGKAEDKGGDFLGPPKDWIEALNRNFVPNRHTHLSSGGATGNAKAGTVEEILPWMKLSAEMNPQMIESYTVGAYWLRAVLNKPDDARDFLFEGLRNNPGNPQLLFDLGRVYNDGFHDTNRALNVWQAGLRQWQTQSEDAKTNTQSQFICEEISMSLAHAEETVGDFSNAVNYLKIVRTVSPDSEGIQKHIDELNQKAAAPASTNNPAH